MRRLCLLLFCLMASPALGVDHGTRTPSPDPESRVGAKYDDPIPCTGGGCPPIEVPYDSTPLPVPSADPVPPAELPPADAPPQPEEEDGDAPDQLECNLALTTYSQDMQRIAMDGWTYFGTIEIPYPGYASEYGHNYVTGDASGISPSCAGATVTMMVVQHWFIPLAKDPNYCTLLFATVVINDELTDDDGFPIPQLIAEQGICK